MPADYVRIRLSQLRAGARLRAPIFDARPNRNQLLLAAGIVLSQGQLDLLKRRGITDVFVHRDDVNDATGRTSPSRATVRTGVTVPPSPTRDLFRSPPGAPPATWRQTSDSFFHHLRPSKEPQHDPAAVEKITQTYHTSLSATRNVFEEFAQDHRINASAVACIAERHLEPLANDPDVFVSLGLSPVTEGYPSRHALQTSMLAASIGTIMGLSKDDLLELCMGCLLHDAGMMLVPKHILTQQGPLSAADRLEVLKHPLYIANALSRRNDVPHGAKATAYQIHERMNGTGYPRKRQHPQIHLFARIGAVADTYLAMVSPRNGRIGLLPHQAVEKLLYAARIGLFDPTVVRALLHAASLFPVGSLVTLNDGRSGRVSRANREQYDRPIVEILADDLDNAVEFVDLSEHRTLCVVGAGASERGF